MSLSCPVCGGLNHVGLTHICDQPDTAERMRRASRAYRADQRAETVNASFAAAFNATRQYIVIPEPPRDMAPLRVLAHVGRPVLELPAGQDVIEGELA